MEKSGRKQENNFRANKLPYIKYPNIKTLDLEVLLIIMNFDCEF